MFKVIVNLNTKTEVVSDVTVDVKDGVSVVIVVLQGFSYFGVVGSCDGMVTTESLLHVPQHWWAYVICWQRNVVQPLTLSPYSHPKIHKFV